MNPSLTSSDVPSSKETENISILMESLEDLKTSFLELWEDKDYKSKFLILNKEDWTELSNVAISLFSSLHYLEYESPVPLLDCFKFKKLDPTFIEFLLMSIPEEEIICNNLEEGVYELTETVTQLIHVWMTSLFFYNKFPHICEFVQETILNSFLWIVKNMEFSEYSVVALLLSNFQQREMKKLQTL